MSMTRDGISLEILRKHEEHLRRARIIRALKEIMIRDGASIHELHHILDEFVVQEVHDS